MNKKATQFTATQLVVLLLVAILLIFMITWYSGLKDQMVDIVKNFFG